MFTYKGAVAAKLAVILISVLAPTGSPLQAQSTLEVQAHLAVGGWLARDGLPNAPILSSPTNVVSFSTFEASPAVSGGIELGVSNFPAAIRLKATTSLSNQEVGVWGCAPDSAGNPTPCPGILIEVATDVRATAATADVLGSLEVGPLLFRPLIGIGWVRYSYSWDPGPVGSFSLEPGTAGFDSVVAHYGAAIGIPVGRVNLEAEYGAFRSKSNPSRPNSVRTASLGISVPI